jgi:hypothetical protein
MVEEESIEWYIEDHAFPLSYDWLLPLSPSPVSKSTSHTQEDWEREAACWYMFKPTFTAGLWRRGASQIPAPGIATQIVFGSILRAAFASSAPHESWREASPTRPPSESASNVASADSSWVGYSSLNEPTVSRSLHPFPPVRLLPLLGLSLPPIPERAGPSLPSSDVSPTMVASR